MDVLFDSNVIIDAVTARDLSNAGAKELYIKAAGKEINGFLVSKQITDIAYVLRKYVEKERVRDFVLFLCRAFNVLPFEREDIVNAALEDGRDFEDDVLMCVARANNIGCIVTNNIKDFKSKDIAVLRPDELLDRLTVI